jgi:hypothetical protein
VIRILASALLVMTALAAQDAGAQAGHWDGTPFAQVRDAASAGDKTAQLELGGRYEKGRDGAPCDLKSARRWYSRAAHGNGSDRLAYSAPVGGERAGRFVSAGQGVTVPGLPEAAQRLKMLSGRDARDFKCEARSPVPEAQATDSAQQSSLEDRIGRFLKYSEAWPTYDGLAAFVSPMDGSLPRTLEAFAQPRESRVGTIKGLFRYHAIDCFEGGRRAARAAPHDLCATAASVARYTFRLDSARGNCLKIEGLESFLATNGWGRTGARTSAAPSMATVLPLEAEFSDRFGGLIVVSPLLPATCLTDFYLYRPLAQRGM